MARPDAVNVPAAFAPHLAAGEELRWYAYGVKQPHILLIIVLIALAILPGIIATALLTKHYLIGLTNRDRFLVLRIKSMGNQAVTEVMEYDLPGLDRAKVRTSVGALFTHIAIDDPNKPFVAKFHRMGMKTNREHSSAIAAVLEGKAPPAALPA